MSSAATRRSDLDWLRGLAVLIMIEAHTVDAWTRLADRERPAYNSAVVISGFAAPLFLFLAGVALALAAGARLRRGASSAEAATAARRRGWEVFALALLFRVWSLAVSGGTPVKLLRVDILNVMGVAMLAAAVVWGLGQGRRSRSTLLAIAAMLVALATPIIRSAAWVSTLPDPLEWYLHPVPDHTTFTLFPWSGFVLAGCAVGVWIDAAVTADARRRLNVLLACMGSLMAVAAFGASYWPSVYAASDLWRTSPSFFFMRVGVLCAALPAATMLASLGGQAWLLELGRSSLFVYWIHVELVYGLLTWPLHRALPFELALAGFLAVTVAMLWLVRLKARRAWLRSLRGSPQPP